MSLDVSRAFLDDGTRIATILGFWAAVGFAFPPAGQSFATNAGIVMTLLYAVARGVSLADHTEPAYQELTPEGVLRDNAAALLVAGPWLLAAWFAVNLPWARHEQFLAQLLSLVAFTFGWTGVALVVTFVIGTAIAALRDAGTIE